MTEELRFDGRVAVVTGAGRGIGAAYARLLAARGADVVVNDLGGSIEGEGADAGPAEQVASEIGGLASTHDVSTVEGAEALVAAAVERFGRIDVLVNNAGIVRWAGPADADDADLTAHLDVHVRGAFHTVRAAWPHMAAAGYGRIVQTTSTGMLGLPTNLAYATAKGGVLGMTRSLAVAGRKLGIKVNAVAPAAATRMAGAPDPNLDPDLVAPLVGYLAHEDCPVTGEVYTAGAGRFGRIFIAATEGWVDPAATVEDVAAHWCDINDETDYDVPLDLLSWSKRFLAHLQD